ncbi:glycosyltransferase family 4 protein [Neobacillus pocheonensis]|uniref:glycosyltransferase family 4 protein n=1 Tax=Neobacillus pocheonensis TaxID=363869 RepID=UPI003D289D1D
MKILMVCTEKLPVPPVLGGAIQTYISGILPFLSQSHDITVMGINDSSLPVTETRNGIHYVRVPGKIFEIYRDGVVRYIQNNHFDLIHIFNRPRLVLPVRAVAPQSKITLSMHNDMFNLDKIDPSEATAVVQEVSKIVTVSNYVGNVIRQLYPQASPKLRTIYSGVDTERFLPGSYSKMSKIRSSIRKQHGLENKTVILFAGRLSANKGVDRLVRALPALSNKFKNLALVIVGSNWFSQNDVTDYVAYVRALAAKQSVPIVTTGFVNPADIHNWFAVADLFVCTSLWQEPLARVHYEAMAAGLPIVTTARGGNPEVILLNENGLIVENPEDPGDFANKITEVLSDKSKMKKMGERGRELAESKYQWTRVAGEVLEVWEQSENADLTEIPINENDLTVVGVEKAELDGNSQVNTDNKDSQKDKYQYRKKSKKDKYKNSKNSSKNSNKKKKK